MNPVSIEKQKLKNDRTEMTIEIHRQKLEKLALEKHNEERRSGFMVWDKLNEIQIEKLENETTCDGVKELIKEYFNIKYDDIIKTKIATDLFFYSYAFCKDRAFNSKCTSTFMSIMYEIFIKDSTTTKLSNNMNSSSEYFKSLLLKHSVERPPSSIKIFTDNDVLPIMTFVIESYYRQFMLYKYIFCPKEKLVITQTMPQEIEIPLMPTYYTLDEGIQIIEKKVNEEESNNSNEEEKLEEES